MIGDSFVTADGVMTINDMIDASVTQLIADLPVTFAVTGNHTDKTVTVQDNSFFTSGQHPIVDENNIEHFMTIVVQAYIRLCPGGRCAAGYADYDERRDERSPARRTH